MGEKRVYTLGEWADIWERVYMPQVYAPNTVEQHKDARARVQKYFPELENTPINELQAFQFQEVLNELAKHYSKSTVSHTRGTYIAIYKYADQNGICGVNPVEACVIPREAGTKKVSGLSIQEQEAFLEALKQLPLHDDLVLRAYLYTGLRRGELLNLTWRDWDPERHLLYIRSSKTDAGVRIVPTIPEMEAILAVLKAQPQRSLNDHVFVLPDGSPMKDYHVRWICKKAARLAGIRHVHPHMLRHTFASRMVEAKVDIPSLAKIIGHSDPAFTMRVYVQVDESEHLYREIMRLSTMGKREEGDNA